MTTPAIFEHPVKRPNFIEAVTWIGPDDDLQLRLSYRKADGTLGAFSLQAGIHFCVPASKNIENTASFPDDVFRAHCRMANLLGGTIPGTTEFTSAFLEGDSKNLQLASGVVVVSEVTQLSDSQFKMLFEQGSKDDRYVTFGYDDLASYSYMPQLQLWVVAGALKLEFGTYEHDLVAEDYLTQAQKDEISDYILGNGSYDEGLAIWV